MEYDAIVQTILDFIDNRITEDIRIEELARTVNYSTSHFCRIFMAVTGTPVMNYVIRRKLTYAQYDLARGKRILDVAMAYGFQTHAGFTKAFKKFFGYRPLLHRLHVSASRREKATVNCVKLKHGGVNMQVQLKKIESFTIIGYTSRHRMPGVSNISDIPVFGKKRIWNMKLRFRHYITHIQNLITAKWLFVLILMRMRSASLYAGCWG